MSESLPIVSLWPRQNSLGEKSGWCSSGLRPISMLVTSPLPPCAAIVKKSLPPSCSLWNFVLYCTKISSLPHLPHCQTHCPSFHQHPATSLHDVCPLPSHSSSTAGPVVGIASESHYLPSQSIVFHLWIPSLRGRLPTVEPTHKTTDNICLCRGYLLQALKQLLRGCHQVQSHVFSLPLITLRNPQV
jgi:hypothetical protein